MFGVLRANGVRPLWIKGKRVTHLLDAVGIVTGAQADEDKAVKLVVIPQNIGRLCVFIKVPKNA